MERDATPRQRQALAFFHEYIRRHGRSPSEMELAIHLGIEPPSAHGLVLRLERAGLVRRTPGVARSVVPTGDPVDARRESLERQAKGIVLLAFRNGPLEDVHAGTACHVCAGRSEYSHVTDDEMRNIMRVAVDRVFTLLAMREDRPADYDGLLQFASLQTRAWDPPQTTSDF